MTTSGTSNLENIKKSRVEKFILHYPGSINNFRSLMDGFVANCNKYWKVENELFIAIIYKQELRAPGREVWALRFASKENGKSLEYYGATILATEGLPDKITISFLDGVHLHLFGTKQDFNDPGNLTQTDRMGIGKSLILLSKAIEKEWKAETQTTEFSKTDSEKYEVAKIESIEYPRSVDHFRAWMDRFLALNGKTFKGKIGNHPIDYTIGYYTPAQSTTREVWNIYIDPRIVIDGKTPGRSYVGMILATEDQPNRTIIDFIDGQCYERTSLPTTRSESPVLGSAHLASHEPIGETFIKITEWIKEGLNKNQLPPKLLEEPNTNKLKDWFDYLHAVKHRTRIKLEYIAKKTGYALSTVKKEHSYYLKENRIQKVTKSNLK